MFRLDILNNINVQILHVININIDNFLIFNIYKKNKKINNDKYIINCALTKIKLLLNLIIYGDFNAYHA